MTLYEQLGGAAVLQTILEDFYRRVFADVMIGYLFAGQAPERLVRLESQFTARMLGATDVAYEGRGMRAAHAKHPIFRGHFHRRNKILEETLADHPVPEPVRTAWMAHARRLEAAILGAQAARQATCDPSTPG
jgi:hemoglobin